MRRQILRSKICGRAMLAPTFRIERSITQRGCCSSLCNSLLFYLWLGWSTNRVGGGSAARPTRSEQESPVPNETGDSQSKCSTLYAERKLATSRAVLLDYHQAQPTSHEFARRGSRLSTCRPEQLRQRRLHQRRDRACRRPGSRWSARRRPRRRR